jgi:hypothetical protein
VYTYVYARTFAWRSFARVWGVPSRRLRMMGCSCLHVSSKVNRCPGCTLFIVVTRSVSRAFWPAGYGSAVLTRRCGGSTGSPGRNGTKDSQSQTHYTDTTVQYPTQTPTASPLSSFSISSRQPVSIQQSAAATCCSWRGRRRWCVRSVSRSGSSSARLCDSVWDLTVGSNRRI